MPIGTPFHDRTLPLAAEPQLSGLGRLLRAQLATRRVHEHEYNAIRNACGADRHLAALQVPGSTAPTPRAWSTASSRATPHACSVGQVVYTPWCDERRPGDRRWHGDAGWRSSVSLDRGRTQPALDPRNRPPASTSTVEDVSERIAALALQGPDVRRRCCERLRRRRHRRAQVLPRHARPHRRHAPWTSRAPATRAISATRSGWTADAGRAGLGRADAGRDVPFDLTPAGMLALDVARIEAGLLLIDVDFVSSSQGA